MQKIGMILAICAIIGCSQNGSEYVGTWKDSAGTVTISKDGNSYLVKVAPTSQYSSMSGTFQGKIQNGELVLNQNMLGNIVYSKSENAILFAGATLKRIK